MNKAVEALTYPVRLATQSLGRRGAYRAHARVEHVLEPHRDMNGMAQFGLTLAYTGVGTLTQMLLPGVFNAIDSDTEGFIKKSGKVMGGLVLDGLATYQVVTHAPIAEGTYHLLTQIPKLGVSFRKCCNNTNNTWFWGGTTYYQMGTQSC